MWAHYVVAIVITSNVDQEDVMTASLAWGCGVGGTQRIKEARTAGLVSVRVATWGAPAGL